MDGPRGPRPHSEFTALNSSDTLKLQVTQIHTD